MNIATSVDDLPMSFDWDCLGKGFVEMLPDNLKAVVSFGMLPQKEYELMVEGIIGRIAGVMGLASSDVSESLRRDVGKKMALAIYDNGNLIV